MAIARRITSPQETQALINRLIDSSEQKAIDSLTLSEKQQVLLYPYKDRFEIKDFKENLNLFKLKCKIIKKELHGKKIISGHSKHDRLLTQFEEVMSKLDVLANMTSKDDYFEKDNHGIILTKPMFQTKSAGKISQPTASKTYDGAMNAACVLTNGMITHLYVTKASTKRFILENQELITQSLIGFNTWLKSYDGNVKREYSTSESIERISKARSASEEKATPPSATHETKVTPSVVSGTKDTATETKKTSSTDTETKQASSDVHEAKVAPRSSDVSQSLSSSSGSNSPITMPSHGAQNASSSPTTPIFLVTTGSPPSSPATVSSLPTADLKSLATDTTAKSSIPAPISFEEVVPLEKLKEQLLAMEKKNIELEGKIEDLDGKNTTLTIRAVQQTRIADEAKEKNDRITDELTQVQKQIADLQKEKKQLETEAKKTKIFLGCQKLELHELQQKYQTTYQALTQLKEEKGKENEFQEELSGLKLQLAEKERLYKIAEQTNIAFAEEKEKNDKLHRDLVAKEAAYQFQLSEIQKKNEEIILAVREQDRFLQDQRTEFETQKALLGAQISTLRDQLETVHNEAKEASSALKMAQEKDSKAQDTAKTNIKRIAELEAQVAEFKNSVQKTESSLPKSRKSNCAAGTGVIISSIGIGVAITGLIGSTLSTAAVGSAAVFASVCAAIPFAGWAILLGAAVIGLGICAYQYGRNRMHNSFFKQHDQKQSQGGEIKNKVKDAKLPDTETDRVNLKTPLLSSTM